MNRTSLSQRLAAAEAAARPSLRPLVEAAARGEDYDAVAVKSSLDALGVTPAAFDRAVELAVERNHVAAQAAEAGDPADLRAEFVERDTEFREAAEEFSGLGPALYRRAFNDHVVGVTVPSLEPLFAARRDAEHALRRAEATAARLSKIEADLAIALGEAQAPGRAQFTVRGDATTRARSEDDTPRRIVRDPRTNEVRIEKVVTARTPEAVAIDRDEETTTDKTYRSRPHGI